MPGDYLELQDIYKAIFSITAGVILGLERELKDKKAGLKTISIICLGATLFAMISKKVGGDVNGGQIAAYIVSGVGFIGAGAIFKDGFTVSGLTTAGIIWLAAAIGTSIGFGEYYVAAIFLTTSFLAVIILPYIISAITTKKDVKIISITLNNTTLETSKAVEATIQAQDINIQLKKYQYQHNAIEITYEIILPTHKLDWLYTYLEHNENISQFTL